MDLKAQRRELLFKKINKAYKHSNGETLDKICSDHGITFRTYANYRKEFGEHDIDTKPKKINRYENITEIELIKPRKDRHNTVDKIELVKSQKGGHKKHRNKSDKVRLSEWKKELLEMRKNDS